MSIAITLILALTQDEACPETCTTRKMHAQSLDHTHGGSCKSCSAAVDVCYTLCRACAEATGICEGCGREVGKTVKVGQIWSGRDSKVEKAEVLRIADEKSWNELWKRHAGWKAPEIDFKESMIVAVLRGKILESAATQFDGVREFGDRIGLTIRWTHPKCGNEPEITDYLFVKLPRSAKKLVVMSVERSVPKCVVHEVLAEFKPLE